MRIHLVVLFPALLLFGAPRTARAADEAACCATYSDQAVGKLKHGVSNTLLGWTAIVREPIQAGRSGGNVFAGFGKGLWHAVRQTAGGVVQVVTFPLPKVEVPIPDDSAHAAPAS